MRLTLAVFAGVAVFVLWWLLVFGGMRVEWRNNQRLAQHGAQVKGTVTTKEPMNHRTVRYEYVADSTRYTGGPCGFVEDSSWFDKMQVGDEIAVTYLPENPAISVCGDGRRAYLKTLGMLFVVVPFAGLLLGVVNGFGVYYWLRRMQAPHLTSRCS